MRRLQKAQSRLQLVWYAENRSSSQMLWHAAIICHQSGLLIRMDPGWLLNLRHASPPCCCTQPHSSNNVMFRRQIDDDYTSFHSPPRQKTEKTDRTFIATHLFIQAESSENQSQQGVHLSPWRRGGKLIVFIRTNYKKNILILLRIRKKMVC